MNASQNVNFSTKFPTLSKDFSAMRKFHLKPLKPRGDIGLKTPNPEGFWFDSFTELQLNAVPSSVAAFYGNTRMLP